MVLCFYGFITLLFCVFGVMALWFYSCMVYGFLVSNIYESPISCFYEDIYPVFKVLKILFDGSSGFLGARLFQH